jgi:hypothetical protein
MSNEKSDLISGVYPKPKHPNAPDFVIGKMSFNIPQLKDQIRAWEAANHDDWVTIDMKVSKAGKGYAVEDTWQPTESSGGGGAAAAPAATVDEDLPF